LIQSNIRSDCVEEESVIAIAVLCSINSSIAGAAWCITTNRANLSCLHILSIRDAAVASSLDGSIEFRCAVAGGRIDRKSGECKIVDSPWVASAALHSIQGCARALAAFNSWNSIDWGASRLKLYWLNSLIYAALAGLSTKKSIIAIAWVILKIVNSDLSLRVSAVAKIFECDLSTDCDWGVEALAVLLLWVYTARYGWDKLCAN
jgi:hypothetical protein